MKAALPRFLISVLNMEFGTLSIFAYGSSRTCTQASLKSTRHIWLSTLARQVSFFDGLSVVSSGGSGGKVTYGTSTLYIRLTDRQKRNHKRGLLTPLTYTGVALSKAYGRNSISMNARSVTAYSRENDG